MEGQLVAVLRVGASLGSSDRGVVDQHVQCRQGRRERVGEAGDVTQAREVGDDQVQPQRLRSVFHQARHRVLTAVLVWSVQIDGSAFVDKSAGRCVADAVGGTGDEDRRGIGNNLGHNDFR